MTLAALGSTTADVKRSTQMATAVVAALCLTGCGSAGPSASALLSSAGATTLRRDVTDARDDLRSHDLLSAHNALNALKARAGQLVTADELSGSDASEIALEASRIEMRIAQETAVSTPATAAAPTTPPTTTPPTTSPVTTATPAPSPSTPNPVIPPGPAAPRLHGKAALPHPGHGKDKDKGHGDD